MFVHYRAILLEGFKNLREGQVVTYLQVKSEKGWQAAEVEVADVDADLDDMDEDDEFNDEISGNHSLKIETHLLVWVQK